ncbi:MAG: hypothetical protein JWO48_2002 [Bryobacterales bacterium]|nr:hypothetical protein [Bryobacterales bacterium]
MFKSASLCALTLFAITLSAQAPGPGGPRGFGPRFGMMSAGPGSRTPVTGAPYSGVQSTQSQQTLADGNQIARQEESKVYRDTQGRVRIEHTLHRSWSATGQTPRTAITIFDPVAGYSYMLDPTAMTAVKMPLPPADSANANASGHPHGRGAGANGAQTQKEGLGTQTVNGLSATGTRSTETIPAGAIGNQQPLQIIRETWISTDLKVPVLIKTSDPRFGNMTMQLSNIVQAEPDASLFQIPSGYMVNVKTSGPDRWRR